MYIDVFVDITEEMELKQSFVSPTKYYNEYFIFDILCISADYMDSD